MKVLVHYFLQEGLSHVNLPATSTQNATLNQNDHKMQFFKPRRGNKTSIKASLPSLMSKIIILSLCKVFEHVFLLYHLDIPKSTSQKSQKSRLGPIKSSIFAVSKVGPKIARGFPTFPYRVKHYTIIVQGGWTRFSLVSPRYTKIDLSKIAKIAFWALLNRLFFIFFAMAKGVQKNSWRVPYLSQSYNFIQLLLLKEFEPIF